MAVDTPGRTEYGAGAAMTALVRLYFRFLKSPFTYFEIEFAGGVDVDPWALVFRLKFHIDHL